jgi:antitoxin VapB
MNMSEVFETRQFKAGNSQAVRLPSGLAWPAGTELTVRRVGQKIIIEPKGKTLDEFVDFLCAVGRHHDGQRVEMDIPQRD